MIVRVWHGRNGGALRVWLCLGHSLLTPHWSHVGMKALMSPWEDVIRYQWWGGRGRRYHTGVEAGATDGDIVRYGWRVNHHLAPVIETVVVVNHVPLGLVKRGISAAVVTVRRYRSRWLVGKFESILRVSWMSGRSRVTQMSKLLTVVQKLPELNNPTPRKYTEDLSLVLCKF